MVLLIMNGSTAGVAFDKDGKNVFMVTINLSAEGIKNDSVSDWNVTIGGETYDYGAPSCCSTRTSKCSTMTITF